jgi:Reverse transcriptase (RNA-dependent DNA polymerase)
MNLFCFNWFLILFYIMSSYYHNCSFLSSIQNDFTNYCDYLKICHINAQSIRNHYDEILMLSRDLNFDILCVSETWFNLYVIDNDFRIPGYDLYRIDRQHKNGGGVAIYARSKLKVSHISVLTCGQIENIWLEVLNEGTRFALGCCYRPPDTKILDLDFFEQCLLDLSLRYDNIIMLGDMNINCLDLTDYRTKRYFGLLNDLNLTQLITEPTHVIEHSGTLIDHIIISNRDFIIKHNQCAFPGISHHNLIYAIVKTKVKVDGVKMFTYRNFNDQALITNFQADIVTTPFHIADIFDDVNDKVFCFESLFCDVIDSNFSEITVKVKKPKPQWLTQEIRDLMKERDYVKRRFDRHPSDIAWKSYTTLRNKTARVVRDAKRTFFNAKLSSNANNSKVLFSLLRKFGFIKNKMSTSDFDKVDLDNLNCYYQQVGALSSHSCLSSFSLTEQEDDISPLPGGSFGFHPTDVQALRTNLSTIKTKAKGVDQIPISLLKLCDENVFSALVHIINDSFFTGIFPDRWKFSQIKPIPKISKPTDLKDFRPISILPNVSKLIEKEVKCQLTDFCNNFSILPSEQSGFRTHYNTVSILLKVSSDIYEALSSNEIVSLVLLDFSKAFDTVHHGLLLDNFKSLGFPEPVINWFASYLADRQQQTVSGDFASDWINVLNGVPQGSVLGPLLFCLYVRKLPLIFKSCKVQCFADDTQIYKSYSVNDVVNSVNAINTDLESLAVFCEDNNLILNPGKSYHLIIGSPSNLNKLSKMSVPDVSIRGTVIPRCTTAKNLGLVFDECFSWEPHVNTIIRSCFAILKPLFRNRKFLSQNVRLILIQSLITPKFDYCDIVFMHMSINLQNKLQKMLNLCIRFIFNLRKYDHISLYQKKLKWLDLADRRLLHLGCLIYKTKQNQKPDYLCDMLKSTNEIHMYNTRPRMFIPDVSNVAGKKCFNFCGPNFWNSIPCIIQNSENFQLFKRQLTKHLRNK